VSWNVKGLRRRVTVALTETSRTSRTSRTADYTIAVGAVVGIVVGVAAAAVVG
jgi:hypothetical protein